MTFSRHKNTALLAALALAIISPALVARPAAAQEFEEWDEFGEMDAWFGAPSSRAWGGVEFLLWRRTGMRTPPLVTTGDPANPFAGILDPAVAPETQIIVGDDRLGERFRPGGRVTLGTWFGPYEGLGVEGTFFALGQQTSEFQLNSGGVPVVTVPFFNVNAGFEDALQLAAINPALVFGGIDIRTTSDVTGGDLLLRGAMVRNFGLRLDWLAGYQNVNINETLVINYSLNDGVNQFAVVDNFRTKNQFHGGALGLTGEVRRGPLTYEFLTKVGLGNMHEKAIISGQNDTVNPDGGFFATGNHTGTFTRNVFAVAPEARIKVGLDINQNTRVSFGYSALYYSRVAQPGDQINRNIDDTTLFNNGPPNVPTTQPPFAFRDNGYWLFGINAGIDWRF